MATDSSDTSRYNYTPADGHPRSPEDFGIATDDFLDVTSDGGSVLSPTSLFSA